MTVPPLLSVQQLRCGYPGRGDVLNSLDLHIQPGTRLALLGANGSGKSTLLRAVCGALRPTRGHVLLDGAPIDYTRAGLTRHRQQVQLVVQDPDDQLFSASVRADISFGPVNLGLDEVQVRERVEEALTLLAVEHLARRPTHQLSYGERRRVAIAGAYAMHPKLLVLDEPTAGLDPEAVQESLAAMDRLQAAGTTLVMATHDVDLALAWADSVAVMTAGTVRHGDPGELLADAGLLADARLRPPGVLTLMHGLRERGLLHRAAVARTLEEVLDHLPTSGCVPDTP